MSSEGIEIPEGWASVPLNQLVSPSKEKVEPAEDPNAPYIGLEHIEPNTNRIIGHGFARDTMSTKTRFSAGSILYGKLRPYLNKVTIPDFSGVCSTDILVFPPVNGIEMRYLMRFLSTSAVVDFATHQSSGMELPRTSFEKLGRHQVPLPPLAEQRRIVARLEALLADIERVRGRLDASAATMQRFRQAVLAAAVDGRLTKAWRNEDEKQTGSDLPERWSWKRCEELCEPDRTISYGVIILGSHVENGIPTLRSSDVRFLRIDLDHVKKISKEIESNYKRTSLKGGEVLVTVRGTLGGVAAVPSALAGYNISREVAMIPVSGSIVDPHYLAFAIGSKRSQNWLTETVKGVTYSGINIMDLKRLPIPVPPLPEQLEIVRRVDALFALADRIEGEVAGARERMEALREAVLAKAFRGELVPTEAELGRQEGREYEPADALLERVRAGRVTASVKPSRRRKGAGTVTLEVFDY